MDFVKSLVGRVQSQAPIPSADSDFADFAGAPSPSPISIASAAAGSIASSALPSQPTAIALQETFPYTKWYRVWERTQPSDFYTEAIILPFLIVMILVHVWGTRTNKKKAQKWSAAHAPTLRSEFALVGFGDTDDDFLQEKSAQEFNCYASGRQNTAFVDIKLHLYKRYNPLMLMVDYLLSMFFESMARPAERLQVIMYTFDGREKDFVPPPVPGSEEIPEKSKSYGNSSYDGCVFAVVNKMSMRRLRDERYDVSLTFTKDHPKLPAWATVMSESAEITETMLTKDLIAAVEQAGSDALEYLIVTDQPIDKPLKLEETVPKKRLHLSLKLVTETPETATTLPLFQAFLRLPDHLTQAAHFRPEVVRKIHATRETEIKKLRKVSDDEAEEERRKLSEKVKKEERDRKMRGMTAEEQRKFLEKENERSRRKQEKKMSRKG